MEAKAVIKDLRVYRANLASLCCVSARYSGEEKK